MVSCPLSLPSWPDASARPEPTVLRHLRDVLKEHRARSAAVHSHARPAGAFVPAVLLQSAPFVTVIAAYWWAVRTGARAPTELNRLPDCWFVGRRLRRPTVLRERWRALWMLRVGASLVARAMHLARRDVSD